MSNSDGSTAARAQGQYQMWLVIYLSATWLLYLSKSAKATSVEIFGMRFSEKFWLGLAPGVATILLLGMLGAAIASRGTRAGWADYVSSLWSAMPAALVHGLIILGALASTITVGLTMTPKFKGNMNFVFTTYCLVCTVLQGWGAWQWYSKKK